MPESSSKRSAGSAHALAAAALCAVAFVVLLAAAYGSTTASHWDAVALHGFMGLSTPSLDRLTVPVAYSMNVVPMLMCLALLCGFGLLAGRGRQVVAALAAVGAANVSAQVLKVVLAHDRFDAVLGNDQLRAAAFPSGHATAVMSLAVAAVLIAPRAKRPLAAALAGTYVLAVSLAILIEGWHFPSDVLAGMLLATGFGCIALAGLRRREREPRPDAAGLGEAFADWAAGAVAAAMLGALLAGAALARAAAIVSYAHSDTAATATAMAVTALAASLLVGFAALARE